jgi:hypothetical protein
MNAAGCLLEELAGQLVRRVRAAKSDLIEILRSRESGIVRWLNDHPRSITRRPLRRVPSGRNVAFDPEKTSE